MHSYLFRKDKLTVEHSGGGREVLWLSERVLKNVMAGYKRR